MWAQIMIKLEYIKVYIITVRQGHHLCRAAYIYTRQLEAKPNTNFVYQEQS